MKILIYIEEKHIEDLNNFLSERKYNKFKIYNEKPKNSESKKYWEVSIGFNDFITIQDMIEEKTLLNG